MNNKISCCLLIMSSAVQIIICHVYCISELGTWYYYFLNFDTIQHNQTDLAIQFKLDWKYGMEHSIFSAHPAFYTSLIRLKIQDRTFDFFFFCSSHILNFCLKIKQTILQLTSPVSKNKKRIFYFFLKLCLQMIFNWTVCF